MRLGPARTTPREYLHSLWLLSARDLRVRYATSALGYVWSVLDPLVMSLIYWFVFTQVFHRRGVGEDPYIVFLIIGLLPWVWFNTAVTDFTRAFTKDAKLVRSTAIPRSIWVNRVIVSKGVEFLFSLPVLAAFIIVAAVVSPGSVHIGWGALLFPVAIVLQALLLVGLGLLIAPLCVLYSDLQRTTRLILRATFYATPVIYSVNDLPGAFGHIAAFNPLAGIFTLYRMALFPDQWNTFSVVVAVIEVLVLLVFGAWVFRALERTVRKEL
ncbi:ABC transporter permease [Microbacterium gorillae]|uniref:ABC transporter permease n=1 Tax=Microbacterium gorillae TaxID=1231063 RepID=UPI00058E3D0C|nr:ABC transporter permease [Microbacterium gorillae]